MKAELIPPTPIQQDVRLTLTAVEAETLRELVSWNVTIPRALEREGGLSRSKVSNLLSAIQGALSEVGVLAGHHLARA